jgi:HEAT repeat protein
MRGIVLSILLLSLSACNKAPSVPPRVSYWVESLRAADAKLRKKAAFTLGNLGTTDPAVVPALVEALQDADAAVRCEAILALMKCGAEGKEAIPLLAHLQSNDRDTRVRRYAARALEELQRSD